MHKPPLISIIVPVYNVEKYLYECINSIVNQTLKNIEIICVNDGSTDGSLAILEEFAKADGRIKVISKANAGYGHTMNVGISAATGEHIGIIESDDWAESDMFETLYRRAVETGSDVVKASFYIYNSYLSGSKQNKPWDYRHQDLFVAPDYPFAIEEYPALLIFPPSIWSAIYKRSFLEGVSFIDTPSASYQDNPFMFEVMAKAKSISVVKKYLVHYRVEPDNQSSTNRGDRRLLALVDRLVISKDILKRYGKFDKVREAYYFSAYGAFFSFFNKIADEFKEELFTKITPVFSDIDETFTWEYFSSDEKKALETVINNDFKAGLILLNFSKRRAARAKINALKCIKAYLFFPWYAYKSYKILLSGNKNIKSGIVLTIVKSFLFFPVYIYKTYKLLKG